MTALIEVGSVSKQFGSIRAVDSVSFTVNRGEVLGFLGPNGAGKSTTMRIITGFLTPTSGSASVCGYDLAEEGIAARARLGYLPEGSPLYGEMTALEFLRFTASVRGLSTSKVAERIKWVVGQLGLGPVLAQPIETLSKGFKRRVGLAQSVLHDPDVLILDEPTDGLDPNQKHEVRGLIRTMSAHKAIIISTHLLEEVDAVCTRAMVINHGKVIVDCTPDELASMSRYRNPVVVTCGLPWRVWLGSPVLSMCQRQPLATASLHFLRMESQLLVRSLAICKKRVGKLKNLKSMVGVSMKFSVT